MVPWRVLCGFLLFPSCFAGSSKDFARHRRSSSGSECQHDGVRVDTKSGSICLCPTGYTGNTCQTETDPSASSTLSDMNVQDGGVISCQLNKICTFRFYVNVASFDEILSNNKTITITGFPDNSSIKYKETSLANNIYLTIHQIHILGIQCVIESVDQGSGKMTFIVLQNIVSIDSVTYMVEFVEKLSTPASHFVDDVNVPSGSRLVCDNFCRLLMVTKPHPNSTCFQVDALCNTAWSFPTFKYGSNCYTEIVFRSNPCQKLCFNVRGTPSTVCYWRLPSVQESASCGCDALCSNATVEDVCCPQNRSINVCPKPKSKVGGVSSAVVIGVSVGTSLSALIALVAVGCFLKLRTNLKKKIDAQSDNPEVRERPEKHGKTKKRGLQNKKNSLRQP